MRLIISVRGPASAYISLYPHDLSSLVTPSPAQPSHFLYVITDNDTALLMPGSADGGWMVWMPTLCMPRQHQPVELETKVHPKVRNHGEGPTRAFFWLKVATTTFTFKTLC